jgi:SUF system FeS assembly protein, NifU family
MNSSEKREMMIDHYDNPRNRGLIDNEEYKKVNMNNESCIDEVNVQLKLVGDIIEDIRFDGEACAICISSASIMTETLKGKNINEINNILSNYTEMIEGNEFNEKVIENAVIYNDIYKQPNRKKCALLPWWGVEKIIEYYNKD